MFVFRGFRFGKSGFGVAGNRGRNSDSRVWAFGKAEFKTLPKVTRFHLFCAKFPLWRQGAFVSGTLFLHPSVDGFDSLVGGLEGSGNPSCEV